MSIPPLVPNWIANRETAALSGATVGKANPCTGQELCRLARSGAADVAAAVAAARAAQPAWGELPGVQRGDRLYALVDRMVAARAEIAAIVATETGKAQKAALGETDGAIALARFFAGEGQRLYGRTLTSGTPHRFNSSLRVPVGVAGLIVAANTPIANVAWKLFPALICGNGVVLKAAEDSPATAWIMGRLSAEAGLPPGLVNLVQGLGPEAGAALVEHPDVDLISFTGSTAVGRWVLETSAKRLAKVSLELGGKNPLLVCDDADLDKAVKWICLSAFSNAGQRCAACSRVIVFESVYAELEARLVAAARQQKLGVGPDDDFGPLVNERQLRRILASLEQACGEGARLLCGGRRASGPGLDGGYYLEPTLLAGAAPAAAISRTELFGPVACLYPCRDFEHGLALCNDSPYGLTACIHTRNVNRAMTFARRVQAGVAVVNGGTYGSEPHMPFGGVKQSGNGWREPGSEALDVYSELRNVCILGDPKEL